jgi:hypothetical protein
MNVGAPIFNLYPNPSTGEVFIDAKYEITRIALYDLYGRVRPFDLSVIGPGISHGYRIVIPSSGMFILKLDDQVLLVEVRN